MFVHNISFVDKTTQKRQKVQRRAIDENILIVGSFPKGRANTIIQYYPGETGNFIEDFGMPNYNKTGIGPYIAAAALENDLNMGVAVMNIRPDDATFANIGLIGKTVVKKDVQVQNDDGEALYITAGGLITTEASGNTPYVRDVVELTMSAKSIENARTKEDLYQKFDALYEDNAVTNTTIFPICIFHYPGPGAWGNNLQFRMVGKTSAYSDDIVYDIDLFNGSGNEEILQFTFDNKVSIIPGVPIYVESVIKDTTANIVAHCSSRVEDFYDKIESVAGVAGRKNNIFYPYAFNAAQVIRATDSMDPTAPGAFTLMNGADGTMGNIDQQIQKFFNGTLIDDIFNITRYKFDIIPDLEYSLETKKAIVNFCKKRKKATNAILMLGDDKSFETAIAEKNNNFINDSDEVIFFAKCQGAYREDYFTGRNIKFPPIYYIMETYINRYKINGNSFGPFAGAVVRWENFDEETLKNPPYRADYEQLLEDMRINYVRLDAAPGAYIASQNTNTTKITDRMEFNNMRITAQIVHLINQLAHVNGYRFNDLEDVTKFNDAVTLDVQFPFSRYVTKIATRVYKKALFGVEKNINYIDITINFKDLSKQTNTTIIMVDEAF